MANTRVTSPLASSSTVPDFDALEKVWCASSFVPIVIEHVLVPAVVKIRQISYLMSLKQDLRFSNNGSVANS